ncbi:ethylene-responsive transcription factor 1B-like [Dorcoceras hygrometricum]|uniref:Ethylene-responsive transcription factor 1B-like n=1 Tax=Dorcoceras hygrometricum TaxID=472368 RepID=A0A2Z7CAS6_9LAMI|nr:ethylene-responsive transcription factor 1B-like [Dorcoceras hygrometricum]
MGSNPSTESNYKTAVNRKNKMQILCMRKETTAQRNLQQNMWPRLQEWYRKEELLERSPTLPRTYQTTVGNDGNSPEKLTMNSTRVRRTEVDNQDNISLSLTKELSKQLIMQNAIINAMKCMRAIKDRIARPVYQLANHLSHPLYPHGVSTGEIIGTTHQSTSHNVAFNQVLQVYEGINNKGKAQNREELLPRSSKPTNEQLDQISQESLNEQQLYASSSIGSTASNKKPAVALNKNQQQPTDVAFAKEHQNDAASTNQNDVIALQHLTTDFFPNNQQLVALNNSNDIVKDTSPLLPTADQKRCTQNAEF